MAETGPPVANRSRKPATFSASALAQHPDCSRTYMSKLEAEARCRQCSEVRGRLSVQAQPCGGAAESEDFSRRSAVNVVAGRAGNARETGMVRQKALPLSGILFLIALSSGGHVAKAQTVATVLAAQIRSQGFACDEAQRATRDAKLSKPDYDVWVLTCNNATYRIGRYADQAAKVEKLK
jgi:hypothetical protein